MRPGKLSVLGVAALLILSVGVPLEAHAADSASLDQTRAISASASGTYDEASARRYILDATNRARVSAGLAPVSGDFDLDRVAQNCSQTQATNDTMAHCTGFQTLYPSGWTAASENVAAGYSVESVVDAWMNSAGHRDNILRADATHLGIGYALSSRGRPYFTQNFATYPNRVATESPGAPVSAGGFVSVAPSRLLDTRVGTGALRVAVAGFGSVDVQVAGRAGVPVSGVTAAVVNVTVAGASAGGFLTVYPSGVNQPTASNVNFTAGQTIANLATVKLGSDGKIRLTNNSSGPVHLLADIAGYYVAD